MPSSCPPAALREAIARKRLTRDQQTFSQRSLAVRIIDGDGGGGSGDDEAIRAKLSSLSSSAAGGAVLVESVLSPVAGSSIGLQQLGQCAVVTFGTSSGSLSIYQSINQSFYFK